MITSTEIRVGNKVNWGLKVCTIQGIHTQTISSKENRDFHFYVSDFIEKDNYYCAKPNDLSPIPLLSEILEKCGFEARIIPSYYEGQSGDIFSILLGPAKVRFIFLTKMHQHSASWLVYVTENIEDANKSSEMIATVAYLHQLQNLYFALTGKELTVAL